MLRNVLAKTLRDQRRALMWWSLGLTATVFMTVPFYPSIRDQAETLNRYLEEMPEALKAIFVGGIEDITSPEGFLNSQLFVFFGPLLFAIFAVGAGSRAIAGEERAGTLDLLLSTPLPRRRLVLHAFGATTIATALLGAVMWAALAIAGQIWNLGVPVGRLAAATLASVLLGLLLGTLALCLGAATGRRGTSIGVASAAGMATYLINSLAGVVDFFDRIKELSPFYYASTPNPLLHGLDPANTVVLVAITVLLAAIAVLTFERRDLAVG